MNRGLSDSCETARSSAKDQAGPDGSGPRAERRFSLFQPYVRAEQIVDRIQILDIAGSDASDATCDHGRAPFAEGPSAYEEARVRRAPRSDTPS